MKKLLLTLVFSVCMLTSCISTQLQPSEEKTYPTKITTPLNTESKIPILTEPDVTFQAEPETEITDVIKQYIALKIASMTLEEKVGQLFLVRSPLTEIAETAARYKFGGYVYFADNFKMLNHEEVADGITGCQAVSDIPMLFAVDEEGGTVNRVSRFSQFRSEPFLSPRNLYENGGFDLIRSDTAEKSELLLGLGINVNLAPVCDISMNKNDFIYARSVGLDAEGTSEYIRNVVDVMYEYNIGSSLKHFPGYGSNADTHFDVVYDNRPYETFENSDFLPFIAGIETGAGSVMISHNIMTCVDSVYPSSLSIEVHNVLRNVLNFDGVIITDDLAMDGIREYTDGTEAAVRAVEAGNDMLCCSDYETQYSAVLQAIRDGRITEERIEESVARVLRWKIDLKLIDIN
ncbi:MAG: glycoside hydrolase family 3 protein [Eubacteriales bacterium]